VVITRAFVQSLQTELGSEFVYPHLPALPAQLSRPLEQMMAHGMAIRDSRAPEPPSELATSFRESLTNVASQILTAEGKAGLRWGHTPEALAAVESVSLAIKGAAEKNGVDLSKYTSRPNTGLRLYQTHANL
jgi:hypothetical protein